MEERGRNLQSSAVVNLTSSGTKINKKDILIMTGKNKLRKIILKIKTDECLKAKTGLMNICYMVQI